MVGFGGRCDVLRDSDSLAVIGVAAATIWYSEDSMTAKSLYILLNCESIVKM